MTRLLMRFALLLALCSPAFCTWTLVQAKSNSATCSGFTCAITVTSTGSQHVIAVAWAFTSNTTLTGVADGKGSTFVVCGTPCRTGNATTGYTDMAYTLSSVSGATTITMTAAASTNGLGVAWELSTTATPAFDTSGHNLVATNCTACVGTSLTLTGTSDTIVTIGSCGDVCSAVSGTPTYVTDGSGSSFAGDVFAHILNTSSGSAPTLNQGASSNMASSAMAFSDSGAAVAAHPPLFVINP